MGGVRAPIGLAGAAVLVVVLELVVFRPGDDPASFITANWRESGRAAASDRMAVGGEVLCLGDSQVKCGLLPRVLQGRLGLTAYNLAVIGGQAPSSYYLLARALKAGARPRAVVVDFTPSLLASDLRINTGMWPELLGLGECVDLIVTTRDLNIAGPLLVRAVLPSLRRRDEVRAGVQGLAEGREKARAYLRNWRLNAGAHVLPVRLEPHDLPPRPVPGEGARWRCKSENPPYVRRLLSLARAHDIPVFWLLPTYTPDLRAVYEIDGRAAAHERFVRGMLAEFPGVTVLDPRLVLSELSLFSDPVHVDRHGAAALSLAVADAVAATLAAPRGTRWIELPASRGGDALTIADAALEDVRQSTSALQSEAPPRVVSGAPGTLRR
jgi:hypothetical protein